MKKFTLGVALVVALTSQQPLISSTANDWNKLPKDARFFIVVGGAAVMILGGLELYRKYEQYQDGVAASKQEEIFNNLKEALAEMKANANLVSDSQLTSMKNDLDNGEIPSMDDLDPEITTPLKQVLITTSEQYLGITNQQDIDTYESIIAETGTSSIPGASAFDDLTKITENFTFDDLAKVIRTCIPDIQSAMEETNANISEALEALQAKMQGPKVPEIPDSGSTPTTPSTGTGSTIQPPAASASFEELQSFVTQNLSNILKLSSTDLSNLKSTIEQQLETAKENLKNATDEVTETKAQENLDTAQENARNFNEQKPDDVDPIEV